MTSLTLPIVVGKKYVRRDGTVVTALHFRGHEDRIVVTDAPTLPECYRDSGRAGEYDSRDLDLVADYIEPAKAPGGEHPYADILRAIADGKTVQFCAGDVWSDENQDRLLQDVAATMWAPSAYRVKPDVIVVNGIEVPAPERRPLARGTAYFAPGVINYDGVSRLRWVGNPGDMRMLERGHVHHTFEAAKAHFNAIIFPSRLS